MRQGNLVAPIIVAIGVIVAAIAFAVVSTLLETADGGAELRLSRLEEQIVEEEVARRDLEGELSQLRTDLARLRDDVSLLANQGPAATTASLSGTTTAPETAIDEAALVAPEEDYENPPTEALTEDMKIARARFNTNITQPRNRTMMEILGPPRDNYGTNCQSVTNPRLKGLLETREIGTIKVTMLRPALDSLERVLARLKETDPDIWAKVGTAGALCARFIRGSTSSVSNHSWGTAIDLTLEGVLDPFADGGTQAGLLFLAEYFNDEGWYWGAGYNREDSMHFEVGEETLRQWVAEGKL